MNKEDKIKKAYGERYNSHNIDGNGWMSYSLWMHFFKKVDEDYDEYDGRTMRVRPKSLQGIENNNGWIKLKGLPQEIKDSRSIWIETKNGDIEYFKENEFLPIGYAVAYQVAEKPKKRIY